MMKNYLSRHPKLLNTLSILTISLLGLQFLFGMYTNLFVEFPENVLGWIVIHSNLIASCHLFLGGALTLLSIWILIASILKKSKRWILVSILGIVGILVAALNGVAFATTQNDANSFAMAIGFAFAIVTYAFGMYCESMPEKSRK